MSDLGGQGRRFWWVNQNQTWREEIGGGFLWSPKRSKNNARNQFYENMTLAQPGDLVFSYFSSQINALGVVQQSAVTAAKPVFATGGDGWSSEGWMVEVDFRRVAQPVRPKSHMGALAPLLPAKYSPLRSSGDGLQGVYLAEISQAMAGVILDLSGSPMPDRAAASGGADEIAAPDRWMPGTEREQLVRARLGQGIFKKNVRLFETRCRVTGTAAPAHLRASHIKPWAASSDAERLDGANGLLLAPHVDHLFDQGWISFQDDGTIMISADIDSQVLGQWAVSKREVGPFKPEQATYLAFHRSVVFRS